MAFQVSLRKGNQACHSWYAFFISPIPAGNAIKLRREENEFPADGATIGQVDIDVKWDLGSNKPRFSQIFGRSGDGGGSDNKLFEKALVQIWGISATYTQETIMGSSCADQRSTVQILTSAKLYLPTVQ